MFSREHDGFILSPSLVDVRVVFGNILWCSLYFSFAEWGHLKKMLQSAAGRRHSYYQRNVQGGFFGAVMGEISFIFWECAVWGSPWVLRRFFSFEYQIPPSSGHQRGIKSKTIHAYFKCIKITLYGDTTFEPKIPIWYLGHLGKWWILAFEVRLCHSIALWL